MSRRAGTIQPYLLSWRWLKSLERYLDHRVCVAESRAFQRLVPAARSFMRNPVALVSLLAWFLSVAPSRFRNQPNMVIEVSDEPIPDSLLADDQPERREIKARIERKLAALRTGRSDPAHKLARRLFGLACSRRNIFRVPFRAISLRTEIKDAYRTGPMIAGQHRVANVELRTCCFGLTVQAAFGVAGPSWLTEMFAAEGVLPADRLPSQPSNLILCIGAEDGDPEARRIQDATTPNRRVCWHYGESLSESQVALARGCDAVFAAEPSVRDALQEQCGMRVDLLPPAIQPRIYNPIGSWGSNEASSRPAAGSDHGIPSKWLKLMRTAEGRTDNLDFASAPVSDWMDEEMRLAVRRYRAVEEALTEHSMKRRLQQLASCMELQLDQEPDPLFSALVSTKRPEQIDHVIETLADQTYDKLELVLVLHGNGFDDGRIARRFRELNLAGHWIRVPETRSLGECLQIGSEQCAGGIIGKMDDDNLYGPNYISELMMALQCSDAAVVGKTSTIRYFPNRDVMGLDCRGPEFVYTGGFVGGATIAFKREVLSQVAWRPVTKAEDVAFCMDCFDSAIPILASSRFNFVSIRRENVDHTWQVPRGYFERKMDYYGSGADPRDVLL